jgi:hypothetical protein
MMDWLQPLSRTDAFEWRTAIVSLLLAFGLTQAVAGVYVLTFRGMSYSRTVVQGMAMTSIITCMLMLAIGNSIAAGIGVAGGLTAVRFRSSMRDPRDVVFVFAALAAGIAAGVQAYAAAIAGTGVFVAAALVLHFTGHGSHRQFDGLLRFASPAATAAEEAVAKALREHCKSFALVTLREAGQGTLLEHAYQISMSSAEGQAQLVSSLQAIEGVVDVTLMLQEPTLDL